MPMYLVETYVPRTDARKARAMGLSARAAAEGMSDRGVPIRYVGTTFLPDDETCFHVFAAESAGHVAEACRLAKLGAARVVPAIDASRSGDDRLGDLEPAENGESRT